MVTQHCEYTKMHWIIHFKMMNFISIKNALKKKRNEIKLLVSSSPLSFFLPLLSRLGTLFKHLYILDLHFQLFCWLFHLFFNFPTTSLPFRDHPLRLKCVFSSEYSFWCLQSALGLWDWVDLDRNPKSPLCLWEHYTSELLSVEAGLLKRWKAAGRLV